MLTFNSFFKNTQTRRWFFGIFTPIILGFCIALVLTARADSRRYAELYGPDGAQGIFTVLSIYKDEGGKAQDMFYPVINIHGRDTTVQQYLGERAWRAENFTVGEQIPVRYSQVSDTVAYAVDNPQEIPRGIAAKKRWATLLGAIGGLMLLYLLIILRLPDPDAMLPSRSLPTRDFRITRMIMQYTPRAIRTPFLLGMISLIIAGAFGLGTWSQTTNDAALNVASNPGPAYIASGVLACIGVVLLVIALRNYNRSKQ